MGIQALQSAYLGAISALYRINRRARLIGDERAAESIRRVLAEAQSALVSLHDAERMVIRNDASGLFEEQLSGDFRKAASVIKACTSRLSQGNNYRPQGVEELGAQLRQYTQASMLLDGGSRRFP